MRITGTLLDGALGWACSCSRILTGVSGFGSAGAVDELAFAVVSLDAPLLPLPAVDFQPGMINTAPARSLAGSVILLRTSMSRARTPYFRAIIPIVSFVFTV